MEMLSRLKLEKREGEKMKLIILLSASSEKLI